MQDFIQIGIVAVALSFVIEMIKARFGDMSSQTTKGLVILLAIILGAGYHFIVGSNLYQPIIGILGGATVFYAFFIKE